jgi:hypothetical protein
VKAEITLDIANIPWGISYITFSNQEYKNICLDSQEKGNFFLKVCKFILIIICKEWFFHSSKIWKDPLIIKSYSDIEDNLIEQEEDEENEKEKYL